MNKNYQLKSLVVVLFFAFAAAILGDIASESLLLANFSTKILPNMFLVNSFFLFLVSIFLVNIIDRLNRGVLFIALLIFHCVFLFLIRIGISLELRFIYPFLFSYSYTTKILIFMIFWTIANDITDAREAKQLFPKIAAGGVLGGIFISFFISFIVRFFEPQNLIVLWVFVNLLTIGLFIPVNRRYKGVLAGEKDSDVKKYSLMQNVKLVKNEPLLKIMATLYFLMFFLLLNQDFKFYTILKETFSGVYTNNGDITAHLSSFLGTFKGISTGVTLMVQLSVAGFFLKKMGTAKSMYLLPIVFVFVFGLLFFQSFLHFIPDGLFVGNTSIFFSSFFLLTLVGVGMRIACFDSIFSPNFQIFFSSMPKEIRGRGKIFIEGVVKPIAISFAGLFIIFASSKISETLGLLILLMLSLALVYFTSKTKKYYTDSIAKYLGGLKAERLSAILNITSDNASESLMGILTKTIYSKDTDLSLFAIDILCKLDTKEAYDILKEGLDKGSNVVKSAIISALSDLRKSDLLEIFKESIKDEDERVVANSIDAIAKLKIADAVSVVKPFIYHKNNRVKINAIIAVWPNTSNDKRVEYIDILNSMIKNGNDSDIAGVLYAFGVIGEERFLPVIEDVFDNIKEFSFSVVTQWINALAGIRSDKSIDLLFKSLVVLEGEYTVTIQKALKNIALLHRERFLEYINHDNWNVKLNVLEIIKNTELKNKKNVKTVVRKTGMDILSDVKIMQESMALYLNGSKKLSFLGKVLQDEIIEPAKECLTIISAILDSTGKIKLVRKKLWYKSSHMRASAIETLENTGDIVFNRLVVSLFEKNESRRTRKINIADKLPNDKISFLKDLYSISDDWVKDCTAYVCRELYKSSKDKLYLDVLNSKDNFKKGLVELP